MLRSILLLCMFAILEKGVEGTFGVDVSDYTSEGDYSCLRNSHGAQFVIVRVYRSYGVVDPNALTNIANAHAVGIKYVDGYIFPCFKCGNGGGQVRETVEHLRNGNSKFGQIWLDIEGSQYWSSSTSTNVQFIQDMIDECTSLGVTCGIYSSYYNWHSLTGNTHQFSNYQLWYAHYDNTADFDDWNSLSFGGWNTPAIKQYKGDATLCSAGVDLNYY